MALAGGVRDLPWLFAATLVVMLAAHPLYSGLVVGPDGTRRDGRSGLRLGGRTSFYSLAGLGRMAGPTVCPPHLIHAFLKWITSDLELTQRRSAGCARNQIGNDGCSENDKKKRKNRDGIEFLKKRNDFDLGVTQGWAPSVCDYPLESWRSLREMSVLISWTLCARRAGSLSSWERLRLVDASVLPPARHLVAAWSRSGTRDRIRSGPCVRPP